MLVGGGAQIALDENPLLQQDDSSSTEDVKKEQDSSQVDTAEALTKQEFADDLPIENSWDEAFTSTMISLGFESAMGSYRIGGGGCVYDSQLSRPDPDI